MLFNLKDYFEEIRSNAGSQDNFVDKYNSVVQDLSNVTSIKDLNFHKDYLSTFPVREVIVPEDMMMDFDWPLLIRLVFGSFGSSGSYIVPEKWEDKLYFQISVETADLKVVKRLDDLFGFVILRLYEIYTRELMELEIIIKESEVEGKVIQQKRMERFQKYTSLDRQMDTEILLLKFGI